MAPRRPRSRRPAGGPTDPRWLALAATLAVLGAAVFFLLSPADSERAGVSATTPGDAGRSGSAAARPLALAADPPATRGDGSSLDAPGPPGTEDADGAGADDPAAAAPLPPPPSVPELAAGERAVVALVIDDLGRSLEDLDRLAELGVPVSYAVLPFETRTREVAAVLGERGAEVLVHLPMEPSGAADPGPGALRRDMTAAELARATRAALGAVPGAAGVNNHMGSTLSADRAAMRPVIDVIAREGLYFLDSRTSAESVGYRLALARGVPAAERQVFLDPDRRPEAVRAQFRRLLEIARRRGAAIAIGHPYPETFAILAEEVPRARAAGFDFVPVSYLLDRDALAAR